MPRSTMPQLSMEIEPMEDEQAGYLKQSDYLKKPQKPSSLKPVENSVEPEEAVEKPVQAKKKRVMSEKQKAALAKAREVSAKKRKEKKQAMATEGTTKPVKAKKPVQQMPAIDEESESDSSDDDDDQAPLIQHEMPHVIQQRSTPVKPKKQSVEERVYARIMAEKAERKAARAQKKEQDRMAREYEQSIREDERRQIYELSQQQKQSKLTTTKPVNAKAILQPSIWEQAFTPKRSPFGF